jgi:hypothetical protein
VQQSRGQPAGGERTDFGASQPTDLGTRQRTNLGASEWTDFGTGQRAYGGGRACRGRGYICPGYI